MPKQDYLVVFDAGTASLRKLADRLARHLDAARDPLRDDGERQGWLARTLGIGRRAVTGPDPQCEPGLFEMVLVGLRVDDGAAPAMMEAYLRRHGRQLQGLALFCVQRGTSCFPVLRRLQNAAGQPAIGELIVSEDEIDTRQQILRIERFAKKLQSAIELRARRAPAFPSHVGAPLVVPR